MATLSDDIFDFLKDLDDDGSVETLDREFHTLTKQHAQEAVKKNVEYRVPPPKDKRSLQYRYQNLSMKKMKNILKEVKDGKKPKVENPIPLIKQELETELQDFQDAIDRGEETLEHEFYGGTMAPGGKDLPSGATWEQNAPPPKHSLEEGFEFDYYLKHLDDDNSWGDQQESPYRRSTKQLREFNIQKKSAQVRRRRPQSAAVSKSQSDLQVVTGAGANTSALTRSYQDLHGAAGLAKEMAPSPVKNTSLQHLINRRLKDEEASRRLYHSVLQEARLMQQKFHTCVNEANYFSKMLGKGDQYALIERDATEEAQWAALLANNRAPAASAVIPKGTGARIAHTLVEVFNPARDRRYLGTDHFFREHGRLQHEFQKHRSVRKAKNGREAVDSASGHGVGKTGAASGIGKTLRRVSGLVTSPSKDDHMTGALAPPKLGARTKSISVDSSADRSSSSSSSSDGAGADANAGAAGASASASYMGRRKEVMDRLQALLQVQVRRSNEVRQQVEDIHAQGWNLFV